jgi:hypothetical protein
MEVSELAQETLDLDWFALDAHGLVGHFAAGGMGVLPRSVATSAEDLKTVTDFFRKQVSPVTSPIVNPALGSYIELVDAESRVRYLQDYTDMASRGLFSFDFLQTRKRPGGYFQVAHPAKALNFLTLPEQIRDILQKTVLDRVSFGTSNELAVDEIENR